MPASKLTMCKDTIIANSDDILQELTNTEIEELSEKYRDHKEELPHLFSFLKKCVKSRKLGLDNYVKVYSPNGKCWKEDGTFIAYMPDDGQDIVMHSLDPTGKNLMHAIETTRRFAFREDPARDYTLFFAVHEFFYPKLLEYLLETKLYESPINEWVSLFCLRKEEAQMLNLSIPSEVYIRKLLPEDISIIVNNWPYTYPRAENKLKNWLKLSTGYGVCLKSDHKLVSWVTSSCLGQLSALQTLEDYKRRGYAALALQAIAKDLALEGFDCCGTVIIGNAASERLLRKLGFRPINKAGYVAIANKY